MDTPKLYIGTGAKPTVSLYKLQTGCTEDGAKVVLRGKGYSDFNVIERLLACGWMEVRHTGPRGGKRYHTTAKGLQAALDACIDTFKAV